MALTQFHILLAYTDTIKGMCLLNQEVVYEDNYNEAFGKLINIIKDVRTGKLLVHWLSVSFLSHYTVC